MNIEDMLREFREILNDPDTMQAHSDVMLFETLIKEALEEDKSAEHYAYPVFNAIMMSFMEFFRMDLMTLIVAAAMAVDGDDEERSIDAVEELVSHEAGRIGMNLHLMLRAAWQLGQKENYEILRLPCEGEHDH